MNRRQFLQSLAALGAAIAVPFEALANLPEVAIDAAWQAAIDSPATFYVNEFGALSTSAVEYYPSTRAELLGFEEICDRNGLIIFANEEWQVADLLEDAMADDPVLDEDGEKIAREDWQAWLDTADDSTISWLIEEVNDWIQGMPGEQDYERADLGGYSSRGSALRFFRDEFPENDLFDIVVVEGDCPGSSYFAAELRMDIDEANELAIEYGVPIRFAPEGLS